MLGTSLAFLTPHNRSNETPRSTTLLVGEQEAGRERKRKKKKHVFYKTGMPFLSITSLLCYIKRVGCGVRNSSHFGSTRARYLYAHRRTHTHFSY